VAICDNVSPRTPVEAKFSLQHASAVVLMRGVPTLADFDTDAAADPAVAALRAKVELRDEGSFTQPYPAHFGASVRVERRDGSVVSHDIPDALGDPENPLSTEQICGKARMLLASASYSPAEADGLIAAALALADGGVVADLTRQLR
jgi:2-methylcitrate dehydratase PrpD